MAISFNINPEFWGLSIIAKSVNARLPSIAQKHIILDPELLNWLNAHGTENKDWHLSHQYIKNEKFGSESKISIMMKNAFDTTDIVEFKMRWAL